MKPSRSKVGIAAVLLVVVVTTAFTPRVATALLVSNIDDFVLVEALKILGATTAAYVAAESPGTFQSSTFTAATNKIGGLVTADVGTTNFFNKPLTFNGSGVTTGTMGDFSGSGSFGVKSVLTILEGGSIDNAIDPTTFSFNQRLTDLGFGSFALTVGPTTLQTQPGVTNSYPGLLQRAGFPDQTIQLQQTFTNDTPGSIATDLRFQFQPQVDITVAQRPGTNLIDVRATIQPTQVIPVPSTWTLLVVGALSLLAGGWRPRGQSIP